MPSFVKRRGQSLRGKFLTGRPAVLRGASIPQNEAITEPWFTGRVYTRSLLLRIASTIVVKTRLTPFVVSVKGEVQERGRSRDGSGIE
ncbi:hypothetical protein V1477_011375 [Vespula maculifrons]|uniref:Uncharacterized protein n=1 Tax=Vespula maculifrons TaxID=7453 RepID=A0ABD2C4L7_VESMC